MAVLRIKILRRGAIDGIAHAHCFTCNKDIFAASCIAQTLVEHGIAVLRDFTGLGHSEGEFANTNFASNIADLVAAADWLRREHTPPALLIGHSLGGAAVLASAASVPEVRAVATIAAPSDASHVTGLFQCDMRCSAAARLRERYSPIPPRPA